MYNTERLNDYQREMLTTLLTCKNSLSIFATGVGVDAVLHALFSVYLTNQSLVLVVNGKEDFLVDLQELTRSEHFHVLTSSVSIKERRALYLGGGLVAVTSRILVVDLLLDRIPSQLISGIVVLDAEEVTEKSIEAFLLHLYRRKNKEGFIKSFSSNPRSFALPGSFVQLEKSLSWLKGEEVFLWPRFHSLIAAVLDQVSYEVEEFHLALPNDVVELQFCLMQLLESTLNELRRVLGITEQDELCAEKALSRQFDAQLRQLIFRKFPAAIPGESKPFILLGDVQKLRHFISLLFNSDPVAFFSTVELFQLNELAIGSGVSGTLLFQNDAWGMLYELARQREGKYHSDGLVDAPKINCLLDILAKHVGEQILIVVKNESLAASLAARMVKSSPTENVDAAVVKRLKRHIIPKPEKRPQSSGKELLLKRLKASQAPIEDSAESQQQGHRELIEGDSFYRVESLNSPDDSSVEPEDLEYFEMLQASTITIRPVREMTKPFALSLSNPSVIVMYDPSLEIIRRIESSFLDSLKHVYFLIYKDSVEEQRFLAQIRNEKAAFERLIHDNAMLPQRLVGEDEDEEPESYRPKVIVDMRDFRSPLPFVLHRMGLAIYPVTLEVGDYVLSRNICVERKSIADLISSLNSGRLYSQLQAMTNAYRRPMLLIEFDPAKGSFHLQGIAQQFSMTDVQAKLCLLSLHFPSVRIIWSPNLEFTARLFLSLKQSTWQGNLEEEPDVSIAQQESFDEKFSNFYRELLLKVDGIHEGNVYRVMERFDSLQSFVSAALGEEHTEEGLPAAGWERVKAFFSTTLL